MERHDAFSLHLGQEVYVFNEENDGVERLYIVHLIYRGDEIRIVCANNLESWEDSCVNFYEDVFLYQEDAFNGLKKIMIAERDAIQRKFDQLVAEEES